MSTECRPSLRGRPLAWALAFALLTGGANISTQGGITRALAAPDADAAGLAVPSETPVSGESSATVAAGEAVAVYLDVPVSGAATETVAIAFADVTSAGKVTVSKMTTPPGPSDGTFEFANGYWDISFTGAFSENVTITVPYDPRLPKRRATNLMVKQWNGDGGGWQDAAPPPLGVDTTTHAVTFAASALSSLALAERAGIDRGTRIRTTSTLVVPYRTSATVLARAIDASGGLLPGKLLVVATSRDRRTWGLPKVMWAGAGKPGSYVDRVSPISGGRTFVRVTFVGDEFNTASSAIVTVKPKVYVTWPHIAASATRTTKVSGTIKPAHRAAVVLEMQRKVGRKWATRRIYLRTTTAGRWAKRLTFTPGTWRLRAIATADALHALSASQWRTLHVY